MDDSTHSTEDERPSTTASEDATDGIDSARRRFLGALSTPPIAAALAGCPIPDEGTTGDGETPTPARVDLREVETGDAAPFGGVVRFADAYAMEAVTRDSDGAEIHTSGRFEGDSHALQVETPDASFASYVVDGDAYQVRDGDCVRYPGVAAGLRGDSGATGDAEAAARHPELTRTGTTTVDGAEVAILELPAGELEAFDEPLTYHVDVETGYLRRLEGGFGAVEYASWGDVEAIEPPGDCRDAE